jgi:hypothetical protein
MPSRARASWLADERCGVVWGGAKLSARLRGRDEKSVAAWTQPAIGCSRRDACQFVSAIRPDASVVISIFSVTMEPVPQVVGIVIE